MVDVSLLERTRLGTSEDSEIGLDVLDGQETRWGLWTTGDLDNRTVTGLSL